MKMRFAVCGVALTLLLSLACDDGGPPEIAGAWLDCMDDECRELLTIGWYFPADGGPLLRFVRNPDDQGCEASPIYQDSSWEEVDDGVLVKNAVGIGDRVLARKGALLESATDGFVERFGGKYMKKAAGVGVADCADPQ